MKKICTSCITELPKTKEYFFTKKYKQKLATGEIKKYECLRSVCKKCHSIKTEEFRVKKRCEEMNCEISEYRINWKKQYSETRTKDLEARKMLKIGEYGHFKRLLKKSEVNNLKDYLFRIENKIGYKSMWDLKRKPKEHHLKYKRDYYRIDRLKLKKAMIANNYLGLKVNQVSDEIIETKRLLIQIKREIKNGK